MTEETNEINPLTNHSGFQVEKYCPWYMFSTTSLAKEGIEIVIFSSYCGVRRHLTIWLDAVFQTVELPAGVAHLYASLAHVNTDTLTL